MLSVSFTGDIAFSGYFKERYKQENLFSEDILNFFVSSDYVVANIECPITNEKINSNKPLNHVMKPEVISTLLKLNANIWNLGNNHILDCGIIGLQDTLKLAKHNRIATLGAGMNKDEASTEIILEDDIKVGMLSLIKPWQYLKAQKSSEGCIHLTDEKFISKKIELLKSKVDYLVVIIHGGEEFSSMPMPYDRKKYLKILDMGADIIVAHHPHVVQNYEILNDKVIFYSLGNFIFDTDFQRLQKYTDNGILLKINFSKKGYTWEYLPIYINRDNQKLESGTCPIIFTNITKRDYKFLWPLAAKIFLKNNQKAQIYKNPKLAHLDSLHKLKIELGKLRHKQTLLLKLGSILAWLHIYKLSKQKKVCNYILESIPVSK